MNSNHRRGSTLMDLRLFGDKFRRVCSPTHKSPLITALDPSPTTPTVLHRYTRSQDISDLIRDDTPIHQQIQILTQQMTSKMVSTLTSPNTCSPKLERTKSKVSWLKKLNIQLHKELIHSFGGKDKGNDLIEALDVQKKTIRRLKVFDPQGERKRIVNKENIRREEETSTNFYYQMGRENCPQSASYKKKLAELRGVFKNSQIPKKLQEYLTSKNLRLPKFFKELRLETEAD